MSRSLSPPRSNGSTRRPAASWKSSAPDEEAQYRKEVTSIHIPEETEEWLKFEMSRLDQCTRIFPNLPHAMLEPKNNGETKEETEENEEEEDENNEEGGELDESKKVTNATSSTPAIAKAKTASYEEILFQVFLQDRKQTMRLRCPLPNRTKAEADSVSTNSNFLPPLDAPSSSRSSSMGSGKGAIGWKAPPKPSRSDSTTRKEPSASQAESAKRLSQGLSVSQSHRARNNNHDSLLNNSDSSHFSVVLDPQEYAAPNPNNSNPNYMIWPSTKAHRLYEESRANRIKIEAARTNNGAVLRQQVFFFDNMLDTSPNQTPSFVIASAQSDNVSINSGHDNSHIATNYSSMPTNGNYFTPNFNTNNNMNNNMNNNIPSTIHTGKSRASFSSVIGTGGIVPMKDLSGKFASSSSINTNNNNNNNGNNKQEELLRQLFPSWF